MNKKTESFEYRIRQIDANGNFINWEHCLTVPIDGTQDKVSNTLHQMSEQLGREIRCNRLNSLQGIYIGQTTRKDYCSAIDELTQKDVNVDNATPTKENESLTPYRHISDAMNKIGGMCLNSAKVGNNYIELWNVKGSVIIIQRYSGTVGRYAMYVDSRVIHCESIMQDIAYLESL